MILNKIFPPQNATKNNEPSSNTRSHFSFGSADALPVTDASALTLSAWALCIRIISETIASLPLHVYTQSGNKREIATNSPIQNFLNRPSQEMTAFDWRRTMLAHSIGHGNGYSEILRDRMRRPGEAVLLTPERVLKQRSRQTGKLFFEVSNNGAANSYLELDDILHVYGFGYDGLTGYSPVGLARRTISAGLSMDEFTSAFYNNGSSLSGVIEVPAEVDLDQNGRNALLTQFENLHKGVGKFFGVEVIDKGMKYSPIGINQKDAEFVLSKKANVLDICRWHNMPPHKLKELDNAHFANMEESNLDFYTDTLLPWLSNQEAVFNWRLISPNNTRQYIKHNIKGILRGKLSDRVAYYKDMFSMGAYSPNRILELEDENGIGPEGDKHYIMTNITTIDKIGQETQSAAQVVQISEDDTKIENFRALINNIISGELEALNNTINAVRKSDNEKEIKEKKIKNHIAGIGQKLSLSADLFNGKRNTNVDLFIENMINQTMSYYLDENADKPLTAFVNLLTLDFIEICAKREGNKL